MHSCKKEVERNNCKDEILSRTINSNWTFTDTDSGIKKNHNTIKTVATIKTKGNSKINYLLPEDGLKRQKRVEEEKLT